MLHRYVRLCLFPVTLTPLLVGAQTSSYERSVPIPSFSIEPIIRSGQLPQGAGVALLAFNAEIGSLGDADLLLRKVDMAGNTTHSLTVGDMSGQGYHDVGMEVVQKGDAYYICGYTRSIDTSASHTFTAFLLKTDTALNFQWQRNYILPAPYELYANAMTFTTAGDLLIAGQVYTGSDFHTLLMKASAQDGALLWTKQYDMEFSERMYAVRELPGGDILLSGNVVFTFELVLPLAMKVSSEGDFRWGTYYNYPPMSVVEQSNFLFAHVRSVDEVLLCGHTDVLGSGGEDVYVVNIDSSGAINWARTYGTPAYDMPMGFQFDEAANELVMLGFSSWFTASQSPTALALRIAPGGLLLGATLHGDTTGLVQNTVLTTTQRLGDNTRVLAGWRGFPADIYYTGVDNDLVGTCNTHPVSIFPTTQSTTSGNFIAVVNELLPLENDSAFSTSSFDDSSVLCEGASASGGSSAPDNTITLFPNPAVSEMVLLSELPLCPSDVVELTDLHGRTLHTLRGTGANHLMIPCGDLAAGLYAVRVLRDGNVMGNARVVVQ